MRKEKIIESNFVIELEGYEFLGRGSKATGPGNSWKRDESLFFRCAKCGSLMQSTINEYYKCDCEAMSVDVDYHRFGSVYGDENILVYKKMNI